MSACSASQLMRHSDSDMRSDSPQLDAAQAPTSLQPHGTSSVELTAAEAAQAAQAAHEPSLLNPGPVALLGTDSIRGGSNRRATSARMALNPHWASVKRAASAPRRSRL